MPLTRSRMWKKWTWSALHEETWVCSCFMMTVFELRHHAWRNYFWMNGLYRKHNKWTNKAQVAWFFFAHKNGVASPWWLHLFRRNRYTTFLKSLHLDGVKGCQGTYIHTGHVKKYGGFLHECPCSRQEWQSIASSTFMLYERSNWNIVIYQCPHFINCSAGDNCCGSFTYNIT